MSCICNPRGYTQDRPAYNISLYFYDFFCKSGHFSFFSTFVEEAGVKTTSFPRDLSPHYLAESKRSTVQPFSAGYSVQNFKVMQMRLTTVFTMNAIYSFVYKHKFTAYVQNIHFRHICIMHAFRFARWLKWSCEAGGLT